MNLQQLFSNTAMVATLLAGASAAMAQLPAPNAAGISTGHTHLSVPDIEKHRAIWKSFGATELTSGRLQLLGFPGMYILLTEREPTAPSAETTANHIGFSVNSYERIKAALEAASASYVLDDAENGQILATLPDGVRVEFIVDTAQAEPIVFHHTHLSATDAEGLRDWYIEVFGADVGERRGLPSALIPGGRVDFLPARDGDPKPSQGTAIDHIGFEVADMDAFAAKMENMGITFNRGPERVDAINLTIAFITDPAGTYIEITEGLDDVE